MNKLDWVIEIKTKEIKIDIILNRQDIGVGLRPTPMSIIYNIIKKEGLKMPNITLIGGGGLLTT